MGYTHYWHLRREGFDLAAYRGAVARAAAIVRHSPVDLGDALGEGDPELSDRRLAFNGRDNAQDDAHETFELPFDPEIDRTRPWEGPGLEPWQFNFCKTARKPYDVVVVAVLAAMAQRLPETFHVHSDGGPAEWEAGVALARQVLSDPSIEIPRCVATGQRVCRVFDGEAVA